MGWQWYFTLVLLFLLACTAQDNWSTPLNVQQEQVSQDALDLCESVTCTDGTVCQAGTCTCPTGTKQCGGSCIAQDTCCTDDDCTTGACQNGQCIEPRCDFGEEYRRGKCTCPTDMQYCAEQDRCIPADSCCVHSQCDSFERCVKTQYRSRICVELGEKKFCGLISDTGRVEIFNVLNQSYRVEPTEWYSDSTIDFLINEQPVSIGEGETVPFEDAQLSHEDIEAIGGFCKEDEDTDT